MLKLKSATWSDIPSDVIETLNTVCSSKALHRLQRQFTLYRKDDDGYALARMTARNEQGRFLLAVAVRLANKQAITRSWVERKLKTKSMNGTTFSYLVHEWCNALVPRLVWHVSRQEQGWIA